MSEINIHAAGTDGFRYTRRALPFGAVYALANVLSIVSAGSPARSVGTAVDSAVSPGSPVTQGTAAVARLTSERTFQIGLHAFLFETPVPRLFIAARESHIFGPDSGSNLLDLPLNGVTPNELTRDIHDVLESANLNTTGALFALGAAMSEFSARHPRHIRPGRLMITISH